MVTEKEKQEGRRKKEKREEEGKEERKQRQLAWLTAAAAFSAEMGREKKNRQEKAGSMNLKQPDSVSSGMVLNKRQAKRRHSCLLLLSTCNLSLTGWVWPSRCFYRTHTFPIDLGICSLSILLGAPHWD